MGYTLAELAEKFSATLAGDAFCRVEKVADIKSASPGSITFLSNPRFCFLLAETQASAVILAPDHLPLCPKPALLSSNPYALYARIAALLHSDEDMSSTGSIHASAVIANNAQVDPTAIIAANAVIGENVVIGAHTYIGSGVVIRQRVRIGAFCKLTANVTVCADCIVGDRVLVHPSAVIGSDGFGFAPEGGKWLKIPQLGRVLIGDDVEIGANVAIDRGALSDTVIENGVKLDNQIHIAHNVMIGADTAMAAQSGIAGSTRIGKSCAIGGSVGVLGHLEIADNTRLQAFSAVSHSILEPGQTYASGAPLEPVADWRRNRARYKQLEEMARRLKRLEKLLEEKKENR
jgi:UDP-3-O-[3-hydroxymyristoyl] glucosamine N-acyltransferase